MRRYGAFGSVNAERIEIVFQGSRGAADGWAWRDYRFKAAVDDVAARPPLLAPWHYRLDWMRWIVACRGRAASAASAPWTLQRIQSSR